MWSGFHCVTVLMEMTAETGAADEERGPGTTSVDTRVNLR